VTETPVETIRRAAKLMRERVAELPPLPWKAEGRDVLATQDYEADEARGWLPDWGCAYNVAVCARQDEAEHIASWSPVAVLAVADWLEAEAERAERPHALPLHSLSPGPLAVARAYLGESA
jgi:hypothetical protein